MTNEEAIAILKREFSECKDTISVYARKRKKAFDMAIKALEQTRWIPVSERLPEVGEKVLCHCQANIYEVLKLTVDGWYHDKNHCYMLGFVIEWMPLPQPYKGESEGAE